MKVLVVGSGGREHALCWKLAASPRVEKVYVAPGNAGCEAVAERVDIKANQIEPLAGFVIAKEIDLTVIGPEVTLCDGLVDRLARLGRKAFGPGKDSARLEGSKSYAKALCRQHNIPTPDFKVFKDRESLERYLERAGGRYPLVLKADGLAAGKGVAICHNDEEVDEHLTACFDRHAFGAAGETVLVEDFVKGIEVSVLVITDGQTLAVLPPARDYKAAREGNEGPNTGGMGAVSPAPIDPKVMARIEEKILVPTVHAMAVEGHPYAGTLYAGLMLTPAGPRVLEYNVRFGDPETQPTLARLKSDLFELLWAATNGELDQVEIEWDPRPAVTVVLTSGGYPGKYPKGFPITGVDLAERDPNVIVFHSGTERRGGRLLTAGGRVLGVTALGDTIADARRAAYAAVDKIKFEGMVYRKDIAAELE
ncbi:MAG: phosphoribosylamine--glycine ligase [Planctomycetes bacterium]|nr:phosphoribosylamine--glycine ligase [Planctomycetota bacterium]